MAYLPPTQPPASIPGIFQVYEGLGKCRYECGASFSDSRNFVHEDVRQRHEVNECPRRPRSALAPSSISLPLRPQDLIAQPMLRLQTTTPRAGASVSPGMLSCTASLTVASPTYSSDAWDSSDSYSGEVADDQTKSHAKSQKEKKNRKGQAVYTQGIEDLIECYLGFDPEEKGSLSGGNATGSGLNNPKAKLLSGGLAVFKAIMVEIFDHDIKTGGRREVQARQAWMKKLFENGCNDSDLLSGTFCAGPVRICEYDKKGMCYKHRNTNPGCVAKHHRKCRKDHYHMAFLRNLEAALRQHEARSSREQAAQQQIRPLRCRH